VDRAAPARERVESKISCGGRFYATAEFADRVRYMFTTLLLGLALAHGENAGSRALDHPDRASPGIKSAAYASDANTADQGETKNLAPNTPLASRPARTPMTSSEAHLHLHLAYRAVVGEAPDPRTLSLLLAQWALETGRGENMWGFNFGGIKSSAGGAALDTQESFGLRRQSVRQRFRTYRSAIEGARDYIQTLARNFPKAFAALHGGSAQEFVRALADSGYFTGDPKEYVHAITRLAVEFERMM
jgi:hypothetical protein